MGKRILLFLTTNILVILTINIVLSVLGVGSYLTGTGLDYTQLLIFCSIWGMVGSFISLSISKFMAKKTMGLKIIDPMSNNQTERFLVDTVHSMARQAGLHAMPEVGYYQSQDLNAFATGPSKNNSLVAVSTGLMQSMNEQQVRGVLGHEIAHIANGDMVTMTLIQGVVNAFTMFLARVVSYSLIVLDRDEGEGGFSVMGYYLLTIVFDIIFSILGSIIVAYFSRIREFKADKGGAQLAGTANMIAALEGLGRQVSGRETRGKELATLMINKGGFLALFSTHPSLESRIAKLKGFS
jgi:heat shock protein HtpX